MMMTGISLFIIRFSSDACSHESRPKNVDHSVKVALSTIRNYIKLNAGTDRSISVVWMKPGDPPIHTHSIRPTRVPQPQHFVEGKGACFVFLFFLAAIFFYTAMQSQ